MTRRSFTSWADCVRLCFFFCPPELNNLCSSPPSVQMFFSLDSVWWRMSPILRYSRHSRIPKGFFFFLLSLKHSAVSLRDITEELWSKIKSFAQIWKMLIHYFKYIVFKCVNSSFWWKQTQKFSFCCIFLTRNLKNVSKPAGKLLIFCR